MLRRITTWGLALLVLTLLAVFFYPWKRVPLPARAQPSGEDAGSAGTGLSAPPTVLPQRGSPAESAAAEADALLGQLRASGSTSVGWATDAALGLQQWIAQACSTTGTTCRAESPECYKDGCLMTTTHASQALEGVTASFTRSDLFMRWPGGKARSAPVLTPGGEVRVSWVLFDPAQ